MVGIRHAGLLSWLHLMRIEAKLQRRSQVHLKQFDLSPSQFDVLAHLSKADGISQQELAARLFVTKGNVCGLLDRMSRDGLVQRCEHPDDRRAHQLHLTSAGQALAAVAIPAHEAFIAAQMEALEPHEQRLLHILLARLDRALGKE